MNKFGVLFSLFLSSAIGFAPVSGNEIYADTNIYQGTVSECLKKGGDRKKILEILWTMANEKSPQIKSLITRQGYTVADFSKKTRYLLQNSSSDSSTIKNVTLWSVVDPVIEPTYPYFISGVKVNTANLSEFNNDIPWWLSVTGEKEKETSKNHDLALWKLQKDLAGKLVLAFNLYLDGDKDQKIEGADKLIELTQKTQKN